MKNKHLSHHFGMIKNLLAISAFGFLAFSSYQILFPAASSKAASAAIANIEVEVEPTIEMALSSSSIALEYDGETEILPTAEGVLATGSVDIYVSTNHLNGYNLGVYSSDNNRTDTTNANAKNSMMHTNANVNKGISAITSASETAALGADQWGFKVGDHNWLGVGNGTPTIIPSEGNAVSSICHTIQTDPESCVTNGSAEKKTITFGANLTDDLPPGTYTNSVVFTLTLAAGGAEL